MEDTKQELLFDLGETRPIPEPEVIPEPEPKPEIDLTQPIPFTPLSGARFSPDRKYRYNLWRRFKEKGTTILLVPLNPSDADEVKNDPTATRMEGFAKRDNHALLLVANAFAFISSKPDDLKWEADPIGPKNDEWIVQLRKLADICVVCWGNGGRYKNRSRDVVNLLRPLGPLHCFGLTKPQQRKSGIIPGEPLHPLYLRSDTPIIPF